MTGICLDLNIWVADLLATRKGRIGTTAQTLVNAVRDGTCGLGPVQLVISWGMLDRLRLVLMRDFAVPGELADTLVDSIATIARKGPSGTPPYVLLGGVGVLALRDQEDRGVLETAFAGNAAVLVTHNFADFIAKDTSVIVRKEIAVARRGTRQVIVVVPRVMLDWIRHGEIVLPMP
ncbi:MAG: PIN domain-containing protein [Gemmatimonadaceae bacterium]